MDWLGRLIEMLNGFDPPPNAIVALCLIFAILVAWNMG